MIVFDLYVKICSIAVKNEHLDLVYYIDKLRAKDDFKEPESLMCSPLHEACTLGDEKLIFGNEMMVGLTQNFKLFWENRTTPEIANPRLQRSK